MKKAVKKLAKKKSSQKNEKKLNFFKKREYLYRKELIMSKKQFLKIPLPKWTWWQLTIMIVVIIFAMRVDASTATVILKSIISAWVK